ncbi:MAG: hypothetical protein QNK27_14480, partial [Desulfuromusa sp.]|nr:hypothetical protein [Desulfuromusa sp.]
MLTSTLHTTWVTRFFVLVYLLISVSTANASFWCQKSDGSSHLESNPVGECWTVSPLVEDELLCCGESSQPGVFLSVQGDDCFDSPVYSSVITPSNRNSPRSKIATTDIDLFNLPFVPTNSVGIARFANLTLTP